MKSYNLSLSYNKEKAELKIADEEFETLYKNVQDELDIYNAIRQFLDEEGYVK